MRSKTVFPVLLFVLAACGNDAPKTGDASSAPPPADSPAAARDSRPAVYLEGMYATSGSAVHDAYDLFDSDPGTGWQTQAGTGPDEGIMLYFPDALPLQSVQVVPEDGSLNNAAALVQVYENGSPGAAGAPGEKIALGGKTVKSLYLRFARTGLEQLAKKVMDADTVQIESFPANAFIGIKEIKVFNDKGEDLRVVPPVRVRGVVTASSTLAPAPAYSPANLFDARKEFVWAEGNPASSGEGEVLTFEFAEAVNITAVQIWNGYQRSDDHFASNARVRNFEFGVKGGMSSTYTLRDTRGGQKIELSAPASGRQFELRIKSIYPGKKYKDLAIGDMVFFDGEKPFVLASRLPEQSQAALHDRANSSPLGPILNRRISNLVSGQGVTTEQSLILRSDGTFVLYSNNVMPDDTESQTLADGNWELVAADPAAAKVRVFGRWNNVSEFDDYYVGTSRKDVTRIFSDELTIDGQTVKGKKMVETFYIR